MKRERGMKRKKGAGVWAEEIKILSLYMCVCVCEKDIERQTDRQTDRGREGG